MGLTSAILSSLCTALMVVTDRFIVKDYYNGETLHAWFVSSVFGGVFGLTLTFILWIFVASTDTSLTITEIAHIALNVFWWQGCAMFFSGVLIITMLFYYFRCYALDISSTTIAVWIAATPVFTIATYFLLNFLLPNGTEITEYSILWFIGIIIATGALIAFEYQTSEDTASNRYYKPLFAYIAISVVYSILLRFIFTDPQINNMSYVTALLPYYWIGFASGALLMLKKDFMVSFKSAWNERIHTFVWPIIFIEIIGMLVFYFEYFGINELNPALVNMVIGAHIVAVYFIELLLCQLRKSLMIGKKESVSLLGFTLSTNLLPEREITLGTTLKELVLISAIMFGIILATV